MHYPIDEQEFLAEMRRQGITDATAAMAISNMLPVINLSYERGRKGRSPLTGCRRRAPASCKRCSSAGVTEPTMRGFWSGCGGTSTEQALKT